MGVVSLTVVVKAVEDIHCCFLLLWTVEWMTAWMTLDHLHLVDQVVDVRGVVVSESDGLEVAKEFFLSAGSRGGVAESSARVMTTSRRLLPRLSPWKPP